MSKSLHNPAGNIMDSSRLQEPAEGGNGPLTPDDDNDLTPPSRYILPANAGDLAVQFTDGSTATLPVAANTMYGIRAKRVFASGTSVNTFAALY